MGKSYLRFWGVRGSYTAPFKNHLDVGGNTPCVEINIDDHLLICDAGTGIIPLGNKLVAEDKHENQLILLSHFSLGPYLWITLFYPCIYSQIQYQFFWPW